VLPVGVRIDKMAAKIFNDVSIPYFNSFFREAGAIVTKWRRTKNLTKFRYLISLSFFKEA